MTTWICLFRGINVGGKNKLPMRELAAIFEAAGCSDVKTYIQSGNVVFRASAAVAGRVPELVAGGIEQRFGFRVPVVTRTAAEVRAVRDGNPFLSRTADTKLLHVAFLAQEPDPGRAATLDPKRSPPDELFLRGREVYLYIPNGIARTKLSNQYLDSRLGTTSTVRNWATVVKLADLAAAA